MDTKMDTQIMDGFLGVAECLNGQIFSADNADINNYNDDNIIIVENDIVLEHFESNRIIINNICYKITNWNNVRSKNDNSSLLIFDNNTKMDTIKEFIILRTQYIIKSYGIKWNKDILFTKKDIIIRNSFLTANIRKYLI